MAGFGMIPQRQQFSAMQQHQMYPMMQQGFTTMPQGMMPQPYPAMFMAPAQPNQVLSFYRQMLCHISNNIQC